MRKILICGLLLLSSQWAFGYQWPLEESALLRTFGQQGEESGYAGFIELQTSTDTVYPIMEGNLIFYLDEENNPLPHNGDGWLVLKHPGEMLSIHSHIDAGRLNLKETYSKSESFGYPLYSTRSASSVLRLEIIDTLRNESINPLFLLPDLEDRQAPIVENIRLENEATGISYNPGAERELPAGPYRLFFSVEDPQLSDTERILNAPFSLSIFLNGEQYFHQSLEAQYFEENQYFFEWSRLYREIFEEELKASIPLDNLLPGNILLEIVASDIYQNTATETFRLRMSP